MTGPYTGPERRKSTERQMAGMSHELGLIARLAQRYYKLLIAIGGGIVALLVQSGFQTVSGGDRLNRLERSDSLRTETVYDSLSLIRGRAARTDSQVADIRERVQFLTEVQCAWIATDPSNRELYVRQKCQQFTNGSARR